MDVTSTIEDVDTVTKVIKISIPPGAVDKEFVSSLDRVSKQVSIKGFRAGKAPKEMVEKLHGDYVKGQVAEKLISTTLQDIIRENSIEMIGSPEIEGGLVEKGKALEFSAKLSIFPKPEVKNFASFDLKVGKRTPTDADIEQVIERMRQSKATIKKLAFREVAQTDDVVEIALVTALEGEPNGRAEPVTIGLGEGQLPKELEEGIVGMKIGETKDLASKIPDTHRDEGLRGKDAKHRVTLNGLSEKVLPEVNDDFAKTLELEVASVLELRMKVRESLQEESERQGKIDAEAALLEKLVELNPFEVPQVLMDEEIRALVARSGLMDAKKAGEKNFPIQLFREGLKDVASKRVKTAILVDRIGESEKIQANEEEIKARIAEIAAENRVGEEEVRKYLTSEGRMMGLMVEIGRSKVMKFLLDRAKIEYFEKPAEEAKAA